MENLYSFDTETNNIEPVEVTVIRMGPKTECEPARCICCNAGPDI